MWTRFENGFRATDFHQYVESNLTVLTSPGPASPLTIAIYIDIDRISKYWSNIFNIYTDPYRQNGSSAGSGGPLCRDAGQVRDSFSGQM